MLTTLIAFLQGAIRQGIPLLLGSTGEIITEKGGHLNLGIPGIMYVGGISGVIGAFFYEQAAGDRMIPIIAVLIPFICSLLGSMLMALIYSFLTVTLRANQNVTGLALTTFGTGIGTFLGGSLVKISGSDQPYISFTRTSNYFSASLPFAGKLGWFGEVFLSYGFLAYLAIVIALVSAFILKRTKVGLNLRAVGESPATADAAGINVTRYKYVSTCVGGAIAGLGGLYYIVDYAKVWSSNGFGDRGWLAIALVIFSLWNPAASILGSFLFGGLYIAYLYIPGLGRSTQALIKMLPYVVTIVVLISVSIRKKRENQPPAALGLSYFREER